MQVIRAGGDSVAIYIFTLLLPTSLEKSEVSATLKYCHDSDVKGFENLSIVSDSRYFMLLCFTCSGRFDDQKGLVYALSNGGCWSVFFVVYYCEGLV